MRLDGQKAELDGDKGDRAKRNLECDTWRLKRRIMLLKENRMEREKITRALPSFME